MQSASEMCRFCGEAGIIKYYYLGLRSKVKQWTADPEMCAKMTAHWSDKDHWINGSDNGWGIKKEVWDGSRFSELSWFWNPDKSWCLPTRCNTEGCKNVLSAYYRLLLNLMGAESYTVTVAEPDLFISLCMLTEIQGTLPTLVRLCVYSTCTVII